MMRRIDDISRLSDALQQFPVVAIVGPRQCGKTTLARQYAQEAADFNPTNYFDLEDVTDLERLRQPKLALQQAQGLVVIDEVQRLPELFTTLRVLVDQPACQQRFLILGSASRHLIAQSSESLAGRIDYLELTPFTLMETGDVPMHWQRGGFPRSFLAETEAASFRWRESYIRTYLEQDLPNLGVKVAPLALRRFWMMLAGYHGQTFNASEIGRSLGLSDHTVRHYLDILAGTFMVRELLPWYENINKRQVKSPKIYFRDSGLYHTLLDIPDHNALLRSRYLGASWEGLALETVAQFHRATPEQCYYWGIHAQAELDLLIFKEGKRLGFEFKYTDKPKLSRSMQQALEHLNLDSLIVISPGSHHFELGDRVRAIGLSDYLGLDQSAY